MPLPYLPDFVSSRTRFVTMDPNKTPPTMVNVEIQCGKDMAFSQVLLSNIFDKENSCLIKTRERALELGLEINAMISDKDQD